MKTSRKSCIFRVPFKTAFRGTRCRRHACRLFARESIYITRDDSIYRSYNVFPGRNPFVSPVCVDYSSYVLPLFLSVSPTPVLFRGRTRKECASQIAAGDLILVARRDNNHEVALQSVRKGHGETPREKQYEPA